MIMFGTRSRAAYRTFGAVLMRTPSLLTRAEVLLTRAEFRHRTHSASTDQGAVGDHVWQEALVKHCLQKLQGSCGIALVPQALIKALQVITSGRRPRCSIASKSCKALRGSAPFSQALTKAL